MKKNQKSIAALLLALSAVCIFGACQTNDPVDSSSMADSSLQESTSSSEQGTNDPVIDVPNNCEVELNETFDFSTAAALYDGDIVYPSVVVKCGEETLELTDKNFVATKLGAYTITYTFTFGEKTHTETRTVQCVDKTAPVIMLSKEFKAKYSYGDVVAMPDFTVTDNTGEEITATVKVYRGNTEVSLVNHQFTIDEYTTYKVVATATDSAGNVGKKEYDLEVRGETEFEYLNSKSYIQKTIPAVQGEVAYNTDPEYIIDGEGSLHFTTNANAMYPAFYFTDPALSVEAYKNIHSLSFWVYNASAYDFQFDLMTFTTQGKECSVIQKFTIPAKAWQYCEVSGSQIYNTFKLKSEADTLAIFMNGYDQSQIFASMNFYFDAFEIHKTALNKNYSIDAKNLSYFKGEVSADTIEVLRAENLGSDIDVTKLRATLTDENGVSKTLAWTNDAFSIPNTAGTYTIEYLYVDGVNGNAVKQSVFISSEYQKLTTMNDFATTTAIDSDQFKFLCGTGMLSVDNDPTDANNKTLLWSNDIGGGLYSAIKLGLTEEQLAVFNPKTDSIRFRLYMEKGDCGAADIRMRAKASGVRGVSDGQGAGHWLIYEDGLFNESSDYYNVGVWKTWETSVLDGNTEGYALAMQTIKENGGLWIRLEIYGLSNGNCGFKAYFDDVEVVKNGQLSHTVEETVKQDLAGAFAVEADLVTLDNLKVKDENGAEVTLVDGKLMQAGKYQVLATVSVNGSTKNYEVWIYFA